MINSAKQDQEYLAASFKPPEYYMINGLLCSASFLSLYSLPNSYGNIPWVPVGTYGQVCPPPQSKYTDPRKREVPLLKTPKKDELVILREQVNEAAANIELQTIFIQSSERSSSAHPTLNHEAIRAEQTRLLQQLETSYFNKMLTRAQQVHLALLDLSEGKLPSSSRSQSFSNATTSLINEALLLAQEMQTSIFNETIKKSTENKLKAQKVISVFKDSLIKLGQAEKAHLLPTFQSTDYKVLCNEDDIIQSMEKLGLGLPPSSTTALKRAQNPRDLPLHM